jgi:hypothetical protein
VLGQLLVQAGGVTKKVVMEEDGEDGREWSVVPSDGAPFFPGCGFLMQHLWKEQRA